MFIDFLNVKLESGTNLLRLYTWLGHITSEMAAAIRNSAVAQFIKNTLLNMKLLSALLLDEYETEVRYVRVDDTAGTISVSRVK